MNPKVGVQAVIQARMGSTRLPGKVLLPLRGKPVLGHVLERTSAAARVNRTVVATTGLPEDDPIAGYCDELGFPVFRGDPQDVLGRFLGAVRDWPCDAIVRITADCPLTDPGIIDAVLGLFGSKSYDYASNVNPPTFPAGFDVEAVSREALERAGDEATLASHREHVTLYIRENSDRFRIANLSAEPSRSHLRCTIDRPEDHAFLQALFGLFPAGNPPIGYEGILKIIDSHPDLLLLNAGIDRYEGVRDDARRENRPLNLHFPIFRP